MGFCQRHPLICQRMPDLAYDSTKSIVSPQQGVGVELAPRKPERLVCRDLRSIGVENPYTVGDRHGDAFEPKRSRSVRYVLDRKSNGDTVRSHHPDHVLLDP